ncbi:MAG: ABC transporter permease subunit [Clostridiales bacterium]|nr:ABC transporter permease subunit [Clostridiales bacterium]
MLKLIIFELRRISRSVFFWIVAAYSFIWPVITALFYRAIMSLDLSDGIKFNELNLSSDEITYLTWMIAVAFLTELPKFTALFTCLHLGRDYTDGIVRNKIIAGHSRFAIFGSYMITQLAASVVLCVIYILSALFGLAVSGIGVDVNGGEMFARFAVAIVVFLVMTATFSVISVIFRRRAIPVILCIIIAMSSNVAAAVIGSFNTPSKACDDYLKVRNDHYEEMAEAGLVDISVVKKYEKEYGKDYFLGIPWKICHPAYVISPMGFEGDYQAGGATTMLAGGGTEYTDEIDFATRFYYSDESQYYIMEAISVDSIDQGTIDADDIVLMPRDFNRIDSLHMKYSTLNWIYIGKSVAWMAVIYVWGFIVFRKKNLF